MVRCLYSCIAFSACRFFFRSVRLGGLPLPEAGRPVLYAGLHNNTSLDEWVASRAISMRIKFLTPLSAEDDFPDMAGTNRMDSPEGVPPLDEAARMLENGESLFIFGRQNDPDEGGHEELAKDISTLVRRVLQHRTDLLVVPVAFVYDSPHFWGGRAELVLGNPILPAFDNSNLPGALDTIEKGLRVVEDGSAYSHMPPGSAEQLALLASVDGELPYALALRATSQLPRHSPITEAWQVLRERCSACRTLNGLPLFPTQPLIVHVTELLLSAPVVFASAVLNFVPFAAMFLYHFFTRRRTEFFLRKRILVGLFAWSLWTPLFWIICDMFELSFLPAVLHLFLSATGGYCLNVFKTNLVQVCNALAHPELGRIQARLREELLSAIL